jgi:flavodoxin
MSDKPQYWFNTKTKQVEKGLKSSSLDRIGPFETEGEAKKAEEIVRARSEAWLKQEQEED